MVFVNEGHFTPKKRTGFADFLADLVDFLADFSRKNLSDFPDFLADLADFSGFFLDF